MNELMMRCVAVYGTSMIPNLPFGGVYHVIFNQSTQVYGAWTMMFLTVFVFQSIDGQTQGSFQLDRCRLL